MMTAILACVCRKLKLWSPKKKGCVSETSSHVPLFMYKVTVHQFFFFSNFLLFMVFNATFNYISVISGQSVLLWGEYFLFRYGFIPLNLKYLSLFGLLKIWLLIWPQMWCHQILVHVTFYGVSSDCLHCYISVKEIKWEA